MGTNAPESDDRRFEVDLTRLRYGQSLTSYGSAIFFGFAIYNFYNMWSLRTSMGDNPSNQEATMLLLPMIFGVGFLISSVVLLVGANILKAQLMMLRDRTKQQGAATE